MSVDRAHSVRDAERADGAARFAVGPDGTRLFYDVVGRGPVVMLCDGIACDGFIWKYLRPHLARSYTVLHWNYRGHGRSGPPRDPARIAVADHARDLRAVLDHADVERAALVGHSMGTQVCLEAWRQEPARVAALALLCGSYGRITRTFHGTDALAHALPVMLDFLRRHPILASLFPRATPAKLSVKMARLLGEVDGARIREEDLAPYFEHVALLDPEMFLQMLTHAGEHTAEDVLTAIRAPTLVLAAGRDTFTPVRLALQMAAQIPDADLLHLPDGSHTAPIEQPDVVNARVSEFLAARAYPPAAPR